MEDLYHDYKLIRDMRVNIRTKARILSELMATSPNTWQVVGITEEALKVFQTHDFKKGKRMGINRSHYPIGRSKFYSQMLNADLTEYEGWWRAYCAFDTTILATSGENNTNTFSQIFKIDPALGLFKAQGFAWKHNKAVIDFLQKLYNEKIGNP